VSDVIEEAGNLGGALLKDLEWVRKADPDIPFHIERAARCEHDARRLDQRGTKLRRRHIDIDLDQANRRCLQLDIRDQRLLADPIVENREVSPRNSLVARKDLVLGIERNGRKIMESAPFRRLASPTDLFDCQAALPFLRARSSVEMLTPDCSAACW
jgi:hypothetical protein